MFDIRRKSIDWAGRKLTLETGRIARQADAAVLATYGETTVLAAVVFDKAPKPGLDFFPLTVNYQEKTFAAGKIPGGFFKREGRPSEKETLVSRLIDRPIRPLFVKGFKHETQVVLTVLSHDLENDPDIVAMVAASAALTLSGVPFMGPIGAARVGFINGEYILNPTLDQIKDPAGRLDLVVAGTDDAVMMVESEIQELNEDEVLGAVMFAHRGFQPVIQAIIELAEHAAKEPFDFIPEDQDALQAQVGALVGADIKAAYAITAKGARHDAVQAAKAKALKDAGPARTTTPAASIRPSSAACSRPARPMWSAAASSKPACASTAAPWTRFARSSRKSRSCRAPTARRCSPAARPRPWWSPPSAPAMTSSSSTPWKAPTRKASCCTTTSPPTRSARPAAWVHPGRREIGHGKLAWRAIRPVLPSKEEFPYTVRLVSEITESNGSSSMATVCGGSLALMDAGVPLKKPVSGIAMGLILEKDGFAVLSDILGDEDHLGDMDFKVAGTADGITSLQMDIKIPGITEAIMKQALAQAKDGRLHILGEMAKAIDGAREDVGEYAPKIETITIPTDKIREVIGTGGKVIREIVATDRRQGRHQRRRHGQGLGQRRREDQGGRSTGSSRSPPSRKSARSTTARWSRSWTSAPS